MSVQSLPWYYIKTLSPQQQHVTLQDEEWHHAAQVMRLQHGDGLILFDGKGSCFEGRILKASKQGGEIALVRNCTKEFASPQVPRINIAFAPTKNMDRTEFAVEKLVELGVHSIHFLTTEHSERNRVRLDRMEKIILAAAKQSRKLFLPTVSDLTQKDLLILEMRQLHPEIKMLCMHPDESSRPLHDTYDGEEDVLVLVGPEGGFSSKEAETMKNSGVAITSLGPHRLRVETAVVAACANIHLLHSLKQ